MRSGSGLNRDDGRIRERMKCKIDLKKFKIKYFSHLQLSQQQIWLNSNPNTPQRPIMQVLSNSTICFFSKTSRIHTLNFLLRLIWEHMCLHMFHRLLLIRHRIDSLEVKLINRVIIHIFNATNHIKGNAFRNRLFKIAQKWTAWC